MYKKLNILTEKRKGILQYSNIEGNSKKYKIEEEGISTLPKKTCTQSVTLCFREAEETFFDFFFFLKMCFLKKHVAYIGVLGFATQN